MQEQLFPEIAQLPAPAGTGLDLPRQGFPGLFKASHRKIFITGPGAGIRRGDPFHAEIIYRIVTEFMKAVPLPLTFTIPCVMRKPHCIRSVCSGIIRMADPGHSKGGQILQWEDGVSDIFDLSFSPEHLDAVIKLPAGRDPDLSGFLDQRLDIPFTVLCK